MGKSGSKVGKDDLGDLRHRFSEQEVNDWYREFQKHCNKTRGKEFLTERDFMKVYQTVFPGDVSSFARHIFRSFDTNHNGRVDFREFLIGLSVSDCEDIDTNLRWAFDVFDVSQNGVISKDEMSEIVKSVYKMLDIKTLPVEYDTPEKVADLMFKKMDKNRDGNLCFEEFREGVMADPFLLDLLQCSPPQRDPD